MRVAYLTHTTHHPGVPLKYRSEFVFPFLFLVVGCDCIPLKPDHKCDRAVAQVVSRLLCTMAARIRAQVRSFGICGGQSGTAAGFSEYVGSPAKSHSSYCSTRNVYRSGLVQ
jgi:hypothetical protein